MQIQAVKALVKKPAVAIFGMLLILLLVGFYALPKLIVYQFPKLVEKQLNRKASLKAMTFNPLNLKISLLGFQMEEADGQTFAAFDRLDLDIDGIHSIGKLALIVDRISLEKPYFHIKRNKDGKFNFASLGKVSEPEKSNDDSATVFPLVINYLAIKEGKLLWEDELPSKPVQEPVGPVDLVVEHFSVAKDHQFDVVFSWFSPSIGHFDWQGKAGILPLSSKGRVTLSRIDLEKLQKILQMPLGLSGQAGFDVSYDLSSNSENGLKFSLEKANIDVKDVHYSDPSVIDAELSVGSITFDTLGEVEQLKEGTNARLKQGRLDIKDISIDGQNQTLGQIKHFQISGINADTARQAVDVESVETGDAAFKAWLTPNGINYLALMKKTGNAPDESSSAPGKAVESSKEWTIKVNTLAFDNYALAFQDFTVKQPVTFNISPIRFKAKNFNSAQTGANLPFEFSTNINKSSSVSLQGTVVPESLKSDIALKVKDFGLPVLQPYVEPFLRIELVEGLLTVDGRLGLDWAVDKSPKLSFKGNTEINRFITRDQLQNKDFIKWGNLSLNNIAVDWPVQHYHADSLVIDKPYIRAIIEKDKTNNFQDIIVSQATSVKEKAAGKNRDKKPETGKPAEYSLSHIQIKNGSSDFADLSLILPFAAKINGLDGGLDGVSSERNAKVKLSLKGSAYDLAPVLVNGSISPSLGDFDISLDFKGMPMPLMSPYVVQFAGYKVEKGKLYLTLNYKVENNQLNATNSILIDQLELGDKVENPNAVSLPLELAIALLKDSDGKININVPVTGSLEDPQFNIGSLIFDALANAISKVVTAPFSALASWLGSDEDLSTVNFSAGKAELAEPEKKKLDDLAKALKEKAELQLEIKGQAYEKEDWPALTDAALYDWLKQLKAAELNKAGKKVREENIELSDDDYKRLLAQLFLQKFPLLGEKNLFGTPKLVDPNAGDFYGVAREKLGKTIMPEQKRLKELAADRAQAIAKYLVQQGGIPNERVFILDTVVNSETATEAERSGNGIVCPLSLKTK